MGTPLKSCITHAGQGQIFMHHTHLSVTKSPRHDFKVTMYYGDEVQVMTVDTLGHF